MHLCRYLLITVLSLVPWADAIASGSPDLETTALPTAYELSRETLDIPSAYLLLDAEQERAADALFSELRDATAPLRETLRAHRAHVRALLASPTPDDARIGAAMLDIERSNRAIRQAIDATTSAFGELLNAEQRRRWQRYRAATKQGSSLPATDPIYDVRVTSGVVYGRGAVGAPLPGEKNLLLDLYEPISVTSSEPLPTIVLIHGGGFVGGS
ncbi:MAG: periplasmic heavy metal sensor, partial [Acidobacteriota bacterium]